MKKKTEGSSTQKSTFFTSKTRPSIIDDAGNELRRAQYADRVLFSRYQKDGRLLRGGEQFQCVSDVSKTSASDFVSVLPNGHRGLGVADRPGRTENTLMDVRNALLSGCPVLELDVRRADKVLGTKQIKTRHVKNAELLVCHTQPTKEAGGAFCNITPLEKVPTLKEVVNTMADVYCTHLSHYAEPPILQLELKGVEDNDLINLAQDCLITIIAELNAVKASRLDHIEPQLTIDFLVTGNTEGAFAGKKGSQKLKEHLATFIDATNHSIVSLEALMSFLRGKILVSNSKHKGQELFRITREELLSGLSCIHRVDVTGCIDTDLAVGVGTVTSESSRLGLFAVPHGTVTTVQAGRRAVNYLSAGINVDIGLFDVDELFIHAVSGLSHDIRKKSTLSLQATHCDFLKEREEPCGLIAGVARAVAIAKKTGCNVCLKTDRPDLVSIALSLLADLDRGEYEYGYDQRVQWLSETCGEKVLTDLDELQAAGLDALTIHCQPVRWSRVLDSSAAAPVLERTNYLRMLSSNENPSVVEMLSDGRGEVPSALPSMSP